MKSRRLFWRIVEKIEGSIDKGQYSPGSRLPPERELATFFNVSRPTIREAIIALEVRGKVEVKTGSGVYVLQKPESTPQHKSINAFELTQARALLEGEVAALAASMITDNDLNELHKTLVMMEEGNDVNLADKMFHQIIVRTTRNGAMSLLVDNLWDLRASTVDIINDYDNVCRTDNSQTISEHREIYNALKNKNPVDARNAMHKHFSRLINKLFDTMEAKALDEINKKNNEKRGRYSIDNLTK